MKYVNHVTANQLNVILKMTDGQYDRLDTLTKQIQTGDLSAQEKFCQIVYCCPNVPASDSLTRHGSVIISQQQTALLQQT